MHANGLRRFLAILVILSLSACGREAAPPISSNAPVVVGGLQVFPAEAKPGETVWIYLERIEATGPVNYTWTVNGQVVADQATNAFSYPVPADAQDAILVTVSVTAQDYHQELSTLIQILPVPTVVPDLTPLPDLGVLPCSGPLLSAVITSYQGRVSGNGTVNYCQTVNGQFTAQVKLRGMPANSSYLFTLESRDETTDELVKEVFKQTDTGIYYRDFPLGVTISAGELQGEISLPLPQGDYAFKFLLKDASDDLVVMNSDTPDVVTIAQGLEFQKGISYVSWSADEFSNSNSDESLAKLAATGANWIALVVTGYQQDIASKEIVIDPSDSPTDDGVRDVIAEAKDLGLRVMLKPHVDVKGAWRGDIGGGFSDADWSAWFRSYRDFILYYARIAAENQDVVQIFCVGTELALASAQESEWQQIVQEIKDVYSGELVYASNWNREDPREWWKGLDYIGVDAYFPLEPDNDLPTLQELKAAWGEHVGTLEKLHTDVGRPMILTEIGYPSSTDANKLPWENPLEKPLDLQLQADLYQAALETFMDKSWLVGMYWWNWRAFTQQGGETDVDYTPYGKPAEQILTRYYGSTQAQLLIYEQERSCTNPVPGASGEVLFSIKPREAFQATFTLRGLPPDHGYTFTLSCKEGDSNCFTQLAASDGCSNPGEGYCDIPLSHLTDSTGFLNENIELGLPSGPYDLKFLLKDPSDSLCTLLNNDNPGVFTVVE